jgi:hypothetical protein
MNYTHVIGLMQGIFRMGREHYISIKKTEDGVYDDVTLSRTKEAVGFGWGRNTLAS